MHFFVRKNSKSHLIINAFYKYGLNEKRAKRNDSDTKLNEIELTKWNNKSIEKQNDQDCAWYQYRDLFDNRLFQAQVFSAGSNSYRLSLVWLILIPRTIQFFNQIKNKFLFIFFSRPIPLICSKQLESMKTQFNLIIIDLNGTDFFSNKIFFFYWHRFWPFFLVVDLTVLFWWFKAAFYEILWSCVTWNVTENSWTCHLWNVDIWVLLINFKS